MELDLDYIFGQIDFPLNFKVTSNDIININDTPMILQSRREVRPIQAANIISEYEPHDMPIIVIAIYITPKAKTQLKDHGINYIDGYGNTYIYSRNTKLYIEKNNSLPPTNDNAGLFTISGGKIIFCLLMDPDRVKSTYRKISEMTLVSLGAVSKTMKSLKQEGFIRLNYENEPELINRAKLLEKWIVIFHEKLLPAMKIGTYSFIGPGAFETLDPEMETRWGGESGAAELTQYLSPQKFTVYTNRNPRNFHQRLRLYSDKNGPVTAYKTFWEQGSLSENYPRHNLIAHPLLIYAELIYSNSERKQETAQIIFNDYIKQNL